jgi:hypothetical protein
MIWTMHVLHFLLWFLMFIMAVMSLLFNPSSIIMSDVCVTGAHFGANTERWMTASNSPFKNQTQMVNLVTTCMNVQDGNSLEALGLSSQFDTFSNMSFGSSNALDLSALDFSAVDTMVTEVNAISTTSVYDFDTDYVTLKNALDGYTNPTQYTDTDCYSSTATVLTCAPDATWASDGDALTIKNTRDAIIALSDAKTCTSGFITGLQTDAGTIKGLVTSLESNMISLQAALGNSDNTMQPVNENIEKLKSGGSCKFIRRRYNGILKATCDSTLVGVRGLGISILLTALLLYAFTMVINHCAIPRFRMYDVGCWHHSRTMGYCPANKKSESEEEGGSDVEMVGKLGTISNSISSSVKKERVVSNASSDGLS